MHYLHLHKWIGYSCYLCGLQILDDDLFVARTGWRLFRASSPAESPKSVFAHENVTCTLDTGGDALQLTSKETRPTAWYARQSAGAFADPKPRAPGRDPVDSLIPRASGFAALKHEEQRRTREKNNGEIKRRWKSSILIFSIVCCSIGRHPQHI